MPRVHAALGVGTLLLLPAAAAAYPGGTPSFVTDAAPYCASCHASVSAAQLETVAEPRAQAELAPNKHIAKIRNPRADSPYADLTEGQREELIQGIERIDAAARVQIIAPATLKTGQVFEVTVEATGGGGPVVGLALVDSAQRWQARPATSVGWYVLEKPSVTGPDGQPQTRFTDGRNPRLAPGLTYVNIHGVEADTAAQSYSTVSVRYRLRAPSMAGSYPLAVAFLYGTEKGSPHGAVETIRGKVPLGGFGANSGRVRFSDVLQIQVQ